MATYAIGDIQGCMLALNRLMEEIRFHPDHDRLWFAGDLVNRGPQSAEVLRFIKGLGRTAVTVLGNHDLHLLAVASGVSRLRPKDTLQHILEAPDRDELTSWLRRQPLLHQENGFVLIHAGLLPQWTIPQAAALAREVEEELRGEGYRALLGAFYKGEFPSRWSDDYAGQTRLGVIVNALTKLRVCTAEGDMDLSYKAELQTIPRGLIPWFRAPGRRSAGTTIVSGHWAALGLHVEDHIIALDSGCIWGKHLTAVRLEDRQVFQVSCSDQW